jgi:hypothetical protein
MGACGVGPRVTKRSKTRLAFGDRGEGVQQISRGASQTIERFAELAAVGLGAARGFTKPPSCIRPSSADGSAPRRSGRLQRKTSKAVC